MNQTGVRSTGSRLQARINRSFTLRSHPGELEGTESPPFQRKSAPAVGVSGGQSQDVRRLWPPTSHRGSSEGREGRGSRQPHVKRHAAAVEMKRFCVYLEMLRGRAGWAGFLVLSLVYAATRATADDPPRPPVPAAPAADQEPPPPKKRFEETVEVVAPDATAVAGAAQLPVRPVAVMAVAGAADNVFRALQTLPGVAATDGLRQPARRCAAAGPTRTSRSWTASRSTTPTGCSASRARSIRDGDPLRTVRGRVRPQSTATGSHRCSWSTTGRDGRRERLRGSATLSLTDANLVLEGRLPGHEAGRGS